MAGDLGPAVTFVKTGEDRAGVRSEVEAWRSILIDRHGLSQDSEIAVPVRQALSEGLPFGATGRELLEIAGGVSNGKGLKGVLMGGAAGVIGAFNHPGFSRDGC